VRGSELGVGGVFRPCTVLRTIDVSGQTCRGVCQDLDAQNFRSVGACNCPLHFLVGLFLRVSTFSVMLGA
jgi:hypothetical protein